MFRTIVLMGIMLALALTQKAGECPCQNGGECLLVNGTQQFCQCKNDFMDKQCQTKGFEIHAQKQVFNISSTYSYYYASLNTSDTYFIQMYFCPIELHQTTRFKLFFEFQQRDNSLKAQLTENEAVVFLGIKRQCLLYRSVVAPPYLKQNGVIPKLVVRIKHLLAETQNLAKEPISKGLSLDANNSIATSKMAIVVYQIPFIEFQSLSLAEHLLIFLLSTISLTVIAVVVFKGALRRRSNRNYSQPARPTNSISHFDQIMPVVHQPSRQSDSQHNLEEGQEECMICLLGVGGTQTRRTPCRHIFHKECIDEWGIKSLTCPFCRASLQNPNSQSNNSDFFRNI